MRRKFNITPAGQISGLFVIGFHGKVDPSQTPARREPVFVDAEGLVVGLESDERSSSLSERAPITWGRMGNQFSESNLGIATKLNQQITAQASHSIVITGTTETEHIKELTQAAQALGLPKIQELLARLEKTTTNTSPPPTIQQLGDLTSWYCSQEDAYALYKCITHVAEQKIYQASALDNQRALYQMSWWLARSAIDDSDRFIAAVGLELSNRRISDAYLQATFHGVPASEIEINLARARHVLEARRTETLRKAQEASFQSALSNHSPQTSMPLIQARRRVRSTYIVYKEAA